MFTHLWLQQFRIIVHLTESNHYLAKLKKSLIDIYKLGLLSKNIVL